MLNKFTWEDFMNRRIVVHCDSKEKAVDFLKECKDRGLRWMNGSEATNFDEYNDYGRETCIGYTSDCGLGYADREYYSEEEVVKIVKWEDLEVENKMEKTFREVITTIKDGETWISHNKIIKCKNGDISIKGNLTIDSEDTMVFNKIIRYRLERKKYSFVDMLTIENQGKEIESLVSGNKYIINKDEILFITEDGRHIKYGKDQHVFTLNEIQGEWYIND